MNIHDVWFETEYTSGVERNKSFAGSLAISMHVVSNVKAILVRDPNGSCRQRVNARVVSI